MPDKEVIDRLRGIIKELEARTSPSPDAFDFPFLVSGRSGRADEADQKPSGQQAAEPGLRGQTGSEPFRVGGRARDIPSIRAEICLEQDYYVLTTVYGLGATPELLPPPAESLPGFKSLEASLDTLEGWVYLDIETTGLLGAATIAFLIGIGQWTAEGFSISQYFLTDRQGEEAMLDDLSRVLANRSVLVTFNGKSFDVPVMQSRYVMTGMRPSVPLRAHLDFLSLTRNMGRRTSYGQSLKEAVRRFTGTVRDGDIPGHLIPALYFIYEREGDASILLPVMKHNRLDILDMACLTWVFGHILTASACAGDPESLAGAGKLHLRRGNLDLAKRCLETAGQGGAEFGRTSGDTEILRLRLLAQVLRKQSDWDGALAALEALVSTGSGKDEDYLSLARCYELGPKDLSKALDVVARAVSRHEVVMEDVPESLLKRRRRLERTVARRSRGVESLG